MAKSATTRKQTQRGTDLSKQIADYVRHNRITAQQTAEVFGVPVLTVYKACRRFKAIPLKPSEATDDLIENYFRDYPDATRRQAADALHLDYQRVVNAVLRRQIAVKSDPRSALSVRKLDHSPEANSRDAEMYRLWKDEEWTIPKLQEKFSLSRQRIHQILREKFGVTTTRIDLGDVRRAIAADYSNGLTSLTQLAQKHDVSLSSVSRWLQEDGLRGRPLISKMSIEQMEECDRKTREVFDTLTDLEKVAPVGAIGYRLPEYSKSQITRSLTRQGLYQAAAGDPKAKQARARASAYARWERRKNAFWARMKQMPYAEAKQHIIALAEEKNSDKAKIAMLRKLELVHPLSPTRAD